MIRQLIGSLLEKLPENNQFERIWILAKTDYIQRYYGSTLGILWAFINPTFQVFVYYFVFTLIFQSSVPNFALYLFSGLLLWKFFGESTTNGIVLFERKRYILENIKINKLDLFISSILSSILGLAINYFLYFVISLILGISYNWNFFYFPLLVLNACLIAFSVSLFLAGASVLFKDIKHIWDMVLLLGLWATPIFYGKEAIVGKHDILLYANPLAGILINVRECILYGRPPLMYWFIYDFVFAIVLFMIVYPLFKRLSRKWLEKL